MSVSLRAVPIRRARAFLSRDLGPQVSEKITPMLGSGPKDANVPLDSLSALSSVVESSQPDDGGQSTTLLLVAFPLPSRSLLAGPDAAISPCTKNLVARVSSYLVSFNFRGPTERKAKRRAFSRGHTHQFFTRRKVLAPLLVIYLYKIYL